MCDSGVFFFTVSDMITEWREFPPKSYRLQKRLEKKKRDFLQSGILSSSHMPSHYLVRIFERTQRRTEAHKGAQPRDAPRITATLWKSTKITSNMLDYTSQRDTFRILFALSIFGLHIPGKCETPRSYTRPSFKKIYSWIYSIYDCEMIHLYLVWYFN